jgi:hypothetical protein
VGASIRPAGHSYARASKYPQPDRRNASDTETRRKTEAEGWEWVCEFVDSGSTAGPTMTARRSTT